MMSSDFRGAEEEIVKHRAGEVCANKEAVWTMKLARRLMALPEGRYQVVLSKEGKNDVTWTVTALGKVER